MPNNTFIDLSDVSDPPQQLVKIATGLVSTPEIDKSLMGCLEMGLASAETFVREPLVTGENQEAPKKCFYDIPAMM